MQRQEKYRQAVSAARADLPPYAWIAALIAATLSVLSTWRGPGLGVDSVAYLSAGVSLAESGELASWNQQPLTIFPPGLPFVGALGVWSGLGCQMAVRLFVAACGACIVLLTNALLRSSALRGSLVVSGTWLGALSPTILNATRMAWSEPPFVVLTLLLLITLRSVYEKGQLNHRDGFRLVVICWTAFAFRYAGLALVVGAAIFLVFAPLPATRKLFRIGLFSVLSLSFPAGWMARNFIVDGSLLGPRLPSQENLFDAIISMARTIGEWILPRFAPTDFFIVTGVSSMFALSLIPVIWMAHSRKQKSQMPIKSASTLMATFTIFAVYSIYLIGSELSTNIDAIDSRLMLPVYVPMLVMVLFGLELLGNWGCRYGSKTRSHALVFMVFILFVAGQFWYSLNDVRVAMIDGIGFNSRRWQESDLANQTRSYLLEHPSTVYTNQVEGLWAGSQIQPLYLAPRFRDAKQFGAFTSAVICSSQHPIVLAAYGARGEALNPQPTSELDRVIDLKAIRQAIDGTLYLAMPSSRDVSAQLTECRAVIDDDLSRVR